MPYRFVLMDLDHTLFDSHASEAAAFDHTLRMAGVSEPSEHFGTYDLINKALWARVEQGELRPDDVKTLRFRQLAAAIGLEADPSVMAQRFAGGLGANGDLYPGAREVLDALHTSVELALVTNGLSDVQRARIDRLGLGRYFEVVVISAEVGFSKPGTEIFELTFERLGQPPPDTAVMVGDSLSSDIAGGRAFGIDTCWFNPGRHRAEHAPTHEISSLDELLALVVS